jgi:hypothetical protein
MKNDFQTHLQQHFDTLGNILKPNAKIKKRAYQNVLQKLGIIMPLSISLQVVWKKIIALASAISIVFTAAIAGIFLLPHVQASYIGTVTSDIGTVTIKKSDKNIEVGNGKKVYLEIGDEILVGAGSEAKLVFIDNSLTVLDEKTLVKISDAFIHQKNPKESGITLDLEEGSLTSSVEKTSKNPTSKFKVKTSKAIIEASDASFSIRSQGKEVEVKPLTNNIQITPVSFTASHNRINLAEGEFVRLLQTRYDDNILIDINGNLMQFDEIPNRDMPLTEVVNNFIVSEYKLLEAISFINSYDYEKLDIVIRNYQNFMHLLATQASQQKINRIDDARNLNEIIQKNFWPYILSSDLPDHAIQLGKNTERIQKIIFRHIEYMLSEDNLPNRIDVSWKDTQFFTHEPLLTLAQNILLFSSSYENISDGDFLFHIAELPLKHFIRSFTKDEEDSIEKLKKYNKLFDKIQKNRGSSSLIYMIGDLSHNKKIQDIASNY